MYKFLPEWPPYSSDPADIILLDITRPLSLDLEWDAREQPDVLGISDGKIHVTVPYDDGIEYLVFLLKRNPDVEITGHNLIAADLPLLAERGINISLEKVWDSILLHYLVNMHLCKSSGKAALDEENGTELRGRGFMNLGTFASIYTNFPHWKTCRGESCTGPCPKHEPMWYNAIDCASVAEGLPAVRRQAQLRGVDKLYPLHRDLVHVLAEMRKFGVRINVPYVYSSDSHPLGSRDGNSLDEEFQRERGRIRATLPFNPHSPKEVVAHFKSLGLADAQEDTISDLVDDLGSNAPEELCNLLEYKELGNGVKRWFEAQHRNEKGWIVGYLDQDGYVHPRLSPFTSNGRLACSSPNFQNIYVRKGEQIRRAIIAPEGYYLVRADYSNAENRVVLFRSGYQVAREVDLHAWVAEIAGLTPEMDFVRRIGGGSPRQAAKSVQHASNILEGLQLKTPEQMRSKRVVEEIRCGARKVYPNWLFRGKVVSFTGANLSRRVYGDATFAHRQAALEIQEQYFVRFPDIRKFQQWVSKQCETTNTVQTPSGYVLLSFGQDEDRMKIAQGMQQANPIAHLTKLALVRLWQRWERERLMRPCLQCHDEILCYVKDSVDPKTAMNWLQEDMEVQVPEMPGLLVPADPTWAHTWAKSDQLSS